METSHIANDTVIALRPTDDDDDDDIIGEKITPPKMHDPRQTVHQRHRKRSRSVFDGPEPRADDVVSNKRRKTDKETPAIDFSCKLMDISVRHGKGVVFELMGLIYAHAFENYEREATSITSDDPGRSDADFKFRALRDISNFWQTCKSFAGLMNDANSAQWYTLKTFAPRVDAGGDFSGVRRPAHASIVLPPKGEFLNRLFVYDDEELQRRMDLTLAATRSHVMDAGLFLKRCVPPEYAIACVKRSKDGKTSYYRPASGEDPMTDLVVLPKSSLLELERSANSLFLKRKIMGSFRVSEPVRLTGERRRYVSHFNRRRGSLASSSSAGVGGDVEVR